MYNDTPVGAVVAFAGQVDPVTGKENEIWSKTDCQGRAGQSGKLDPDVPLNHLEAGGWMLCDGRFLGATIYPELFAVLGFLYGEGTGSDGPTFRIPDYRGLFLRGVDAGAGMDPQAADRKSPDGSNAQVSGIGSLQCDAFEDHTHNYNSVNLGSPSGSGSSAGTTSTPTKTTSPNSPARFGPETRPKNVAVNYVIKYR